jgi:voltage-gated potassium channel
MVSFLSRLRLRPVVIVVVGAVVVLLAGGGFAAVESRQVNSYAEGVWWALSLMTTVGFVGEAPESTAGRVLSSILMVSGFGLMTLLTATIASLFVREDELPEELAEREFEKVALARLEELHRKIDALEQRLEAAPRQGDDER